MANQFSVDTASLRAAGSQFTTQGGALSDALNQLRTGLAGVAGAIGGDDQGHQFAGQYQPNAAMLEGVLAEMVTGLDNVGRAFPVMADNYDGADGASQAGGG
jgi:hypothetical protein